MRKKEKIMTTKNPSAFSVRELINQNQLIPFRTVQIPTTGYISGNGGTLTFHASGFVNRANVREFLFFGDGTTPTNFDVQLYTTSSCISSEIQYWYSGINTREIDMPNQPVMIIDKDATECLHGTVINNSTTSGMIINYIGLMYNRMLEVS